MIGRIFLISAALLAPMAATVAHATVRKSEGSWELSLRRLVWTSASRETKINLFTHLPGLFPLPFLCTLTQENGARTTLLPGDVGEAKDGEALLWCPDTLTANLQSGTSFRLEQEDRYPAFYLKKGSARLAYGKGPILVLSDLYTFRGLGEAPQNRIITMIGPESFTIGCNEGLIDGQLSELTDSDPSKKFIWAHNCRLGLRTPSDILVYLSHGEGVHPGDIELPRNLWPKWEINDHFAALGFPNELSGNPDTNPDENPLLIWFSPKALPTGNLNFVWLATPTKTILDKTNCTLYTQTNDSQPPVAGHQFEAIGETGQITLQRDFQSLFISLVCTRGKYTLASNTITPTGEKSSAP